MGERVRWWWRGDGGGVRWWSVDRDGGRGEMTTQEDEKGNEVCYTNGRWVLTN